MEGATTFGSVLGKVDAMCVELTDLRALQQRLEDALSGIRDDVAVLSNASGGRTVSSSLEANRLLAPDAAAQPQEGNGQPTNNTLVNEAKEGVASQEKTGSVIGQEKTSSETKETTPTMVPADDEEVRSLLSEELDPKRGSFAVLKVGKKRGTRQSTSSNRAREMDEKIDLLGLEGWSKSCEGGTDSKSMLPNLSTRHFHRDNHHNRSKCFRKLKIIVLSSAFDNAMAFIIVLNSVLLGLETEFMARSPIAMPPAWVTYLQETFTGIFFVEMTLRIYVLRWNYLYVDFLWNLFDMLVVLVSSAEMIIRMLRASSDSNLNNLSALRVLRILRVVRVVRVIRVFRFFRELRTMVYSIMGSAQSLLWAVVLLYSTLYVVGVFITQVVATHVADADPPLHPEQAQVYRDFFGTLFLTIYYLLMCVTGGISWMEVANPLLDIHWAYALFMCLFISFTLLALLNIITGVFVEGAIQKAQSDKEARIQNELEEEAHKVSLLEEVFKEIDKENVGAISEEDFTALAADARVKAYFRSLGVHMDKAFQLFRLLDLDGSKSVNISEFVMGCMRLQGSAKNVDVATLMYENKRMMAKWVQFMAFVEEQFDYLHSCLKRFALTNSVNSLRAQQLEMNGSIDIRFAGI